MCKVIEDWAKENKLPISAKSNIHVFGGEGKIFKTEDGGITWKEKTYSYDGLISADFINEKIGFIVGGDYTNPADNSANKAFTSDGGETWELRSNGSGPGYKSSVKYIPGSNGKGLVAVGGNGISYSSDAGITWILLSEENFHTIEFLNETTAYAAGNGKIAKLIF